MNGILAPVLGCVLIVASVQKLGTRGVTIAGTDGLMNFVVPWELVLGLLLAANVVPRLTRLAALLTFSLFAGVALVRALQGVASCNCFGDLRTDPRLILAVDIFAVAALLRWSPRIQIERPHGMRAMRLCVVGGATAIIAALTWTFHRSESGTIHGTASLRKGSYVSVEAQRWIGERFPLFSFIRVSEPMARGRWNVVLHRKGCPECERLLRGYRHQTMTITDTTRLAFIEVPSPIKWGRHSANFPGLTLQLSDEYQWMIQTPVTIEIANGYVESVH